jgi:hypothetical protein
LNLPQGLTTSGEIDGHNCTLHGAQGQITATQRSQSRAGCPIVHSKFSHYTNKLNAKEVRLRARKLTKEDVRKYRRFDTLATTLCDQQDALDEAQQRCDELVQSNSAQITQLSRNHEARFEKEMRQPAAQASMRLYSPVNTNTTLK